MTDYDKLKVADLRGLLKERGIPSTGLTRKAQIIEKLQEHDSANAAEASEEIATAADAPQQGDEVIDETQGEAASANDEVPAQQDAAMDDAPEVENNEAPSVDDTASATKQPEEGSEAVEEEGVSVEPVKVQTPPMLDPSPAPEANSAAATAEGAQTVEEGAEATAQEGAEGEVQKNEEPESVQEASTEQSKTETMDFAPAVKTPSPASNERPSIERPIPAPVHEQSIDSVSIASEEYEADKRKRKRRSTSPDLPLQDIKAKKPRPSDDVPDVHLKEDEDIIMVQRAPEDDVPNEDKSVETNGDNVPTVVEEQQKDQTDVTPTAEAPEIKEPTERNQDQRAAPPKREKDARYKELFKPAAPGPRAAATTPDENDDSPIAPALHVATPALYIRDLMRPLRVEALRAHLISLATPPSASPDADILKAIFLDSMKTHALLLFSNTAAASRVRASLHNTVWPAESQRKALWIDFVPEDKVLDWIKEEEDHIAAEKEGRAAGKPVPPKRFEVVYPTNPDDGSVEAVFQEVGSKAPRNAPTGPRSNLERRRSEQQAPVPAPTTDEDAKRNLGKSFQTLDQLFLSTEAKPKLYFLPMTDEIADDRLEDLKYETSRDWQHGYKMRGRGAHLDQKMRYSFDDQDRVVEVGGDFGPWADDSRPSGGRGGRGGGFRSDRGRVGPWRGGRGWAR